MSKINIHYHAATLLIAGSVILTACSNSKHSNEKNETPVVVSVGSAVRQSSSTLHASGHVESRETAVISTRIMGFLTSIKVKAGDNVQPGQLLATISNADLLAKRGQAVAQIAEAEAALADAQKDYNRFQDLYQKQSVSGKELENIALKYQSMKAKVDAAHQLKSEVDAMFAYTNLTAPFAGTVIQRALAEGSMASPGMPILMLEKADGFQIIASVTESEIAELKIGAPVLVEINSIGRKFEGTITELSPSSQFNGGQYSLKVSIPDRERQGLFSGMYASVSFVVQKNDLEGSNVVVPFSAIVRKDQLTGIYTVSDDSKALLHWVKLGKTVGNTVEVLSGLNENEKFIVQSEGKLYNGTLVQVK